MSRIITLAPCVVAEATNTATAPMHAMASHKGTMSICIAAWTANVAAEITHTSTVTSHSRSATTCVSNVAACVHPFDPSSEAHEKWRRRLL